VVAVVRLTGTARATGKWLDVTMYELWRIRGGKAVECRSIVWDTARMLEILGEKR
jgi:ketosteroid isomerase-like protein